MAEPPLAASSPCGAARRDQAQRHLADQLERELAVLVAAKAPQLAGQVGCGTLTAARIIAEVGDDPAFAATHNSRLAGVAPIPASSGRTDRWRLDRRGNRRLNCALHRWAVTRGRLDPETRDYLARKQAEGKNRCWPRRQ